MWNKLLNRLETILEPQIDESQFVTHYEPALKYTQTKAPVRYSFDITEQTQLNNKSVKNTYTQELHVQFSYRSNEGHNFKIETSNYNFILDKSLVAQSSLINDLALVTSELELLVTEKGIIKLITNYKEILQKWDKLKETLLKRYIGNQTKVYINAIDITLKDEKLFLDDLKQNRILGMLFNGYQTIHKKDKPRDITISNVIHCLPLTFKEQIKKIEDDDKQKKIQILGSMNTIADETLKEIDDYFKFNNIGSASVFLSNYTKNIILDKETGFPDLVSLDFEILNGRGYIRKQSFNLKQIHHG